MGLKKRAAEGIIVAGVLLAMAAAAQSISNGSYTMSDAVAEAGIAQDGAVSVAAGAVGYLYALESDGDADLDASVEYNDVTLVAASEASDNALAADALTAGSVQMVAASYEAATLAVSIDDASDTSAQTEDVLAVNEAVENEGLSIATASLQVDTSDDDADLDDIVGTQDSLVDDGDSLAAAEASSEADNADADDASEDDGYDWDSILLADVNKYLNVRAEASEDAEIVGKMYQGDAAEIVEAGDDWTHIVSGNVDGYVKNEYCLTGDDAMEYAEENIDMMATVETNGLRVRSEASEDGSIVTAVSTGTMLVVDTETEEETDDEWVPVLYGGKTCYVSAEYVTTDLAFGTAVTLEEDAAAKAKSAQTTSTTTVQNEAIAASVDDVTLLAALIQCEAGSECYEGQLAVGAVVVNRVRSGRYPSSVYDVIYQSGQFTPARRESVATVVVNGPKASCIQAAQEALNGTDNTGGALHFKRASSGQAGVVIGNQVFY